MRLRVLLLRLVVEPDGFALELFAVGLERIQPLQIAADVRFELALDVGFELGLLRRGRTRRAPRRLRGRRRGARLGRGARLRSAPSSARRRGPGGNRRAARPPRARARARPPPRRPALPLPLLPLPLPRPLPPASVCSSVCSSACSSGSPSCPPPAPSASGSSGARVSSGADSSARSSASTTASPTSSCQACSARARPSLPPDATMSSSKMKPSRSAKVIASFMHCAGLADSSNLPWKRYRTTWPDCTEDSPSDRARFPYSSACRTMAAREGPTGSSSMSTIGLFREAWKPRRPASDRSSASRVGRNIASLSATPTRSLRLREVQ